MSYKSQLTSPSAGKATRHLPVQGSWGSLPANLQEVKFLRSWLVYDSDFPRRYVPGRVNWNLVLGLAAVVTVSATFWAGVGLMIAHVWK